jgi:hypothetical protein
VQANSSVGYCALASIPSVTISERNTASGVLALGALVNGVDNSASGYSALRQLATGDLNTAFGSSAGSNVTGSCNVIIGANVSPLANAGNCQLAIGLPSGQYWITGTNTGAIKPGAGIIDCAGSCGSAGQVLSSDGANAIEWVTGGGGATPATPLVEGIVFGCTDATAFNYGLGDGIFGALTTGTLNIAIGAGALASTDTGTSNTAVGIGALYTNTAGVQNVALGQQALFANIVGVNSTAIGSQALQNALGSNNTALGNFAGNLVTTGCFNILLGDQAGGAGAGALDTGNCNIVIGNRISVANNAGDNQLAIGMDTFCWLSGTSTGAIKPGAGIIDCAASTGTAGQVLMSNGSNAICWGAAGGGGSAATPTAAGTVLGCTTATNTSLGCNALLNAAISGTDNVAIGVGAGDVVSTGTNNILVGSGAGGALTSGGSNVAIGSQAMAAATTGGSNTYVGHLAGSTATTANNVFIGVCSGYAGAQGTNVAIGNCAMKAATFGNLNTYVGTGAAATSLCVGARNVGIGYNSMCNNSMTLATTDNVAIGFTALPRLTTGICNVVVGGNTGAFVNTGSCNVLIGVQSGSSIDTGVNNVVIGSSADTASAAASNSVTLGNNLVTVIRAQVTTITALSDARDKTAVTALPVGLDFVNSLNPVKFTWQMREPNEVKDGTSEAGFIAQELQAAQEAAGAADYLGLVYDENPEKLEASAGKLLPVLVKAIQELSTKVETLEAKLASNG